MTDRWKPLLLALLLTFSAALSGAGLDGVGPISLANAREVQGIRLQHGHATIHLRTGTVAELVSGGRAIGLFFRGQGSFEYESREPAEFAVMDYNFGQASSLPLGKTAGGRSFGCAFESLQLVWLGLPAPALEGPTAALPAEAFTKHATLFAAVQAPPAFVGASLQRENAPAKPYVRAEMTGGPETLVYEADPIESRTESVHQFRVIKNSPSLVRSLLFPVVLSSQAMGRSFKETPVPPFTLKHVDLDLRTSDQRNATLKVAETIVANHPGQRLLRFNLRHETFSMNGVGELDQRRVQVRAVLDSIGRNLAFHHGHDTLLVDAGQPLPPGQPVTLSFLIEGDFLVQPGGDSFWQLGTSDWFPQPELNGQNLTWHAVVRLKKPWIAFTNGDTVRRAEEGEYNLLETRTDKPIAFPVVLGGSYHSIEETRGGLTVRISSYAVKPGVFGKVLLESAFRVVRYYENFLGPYPFKELNIIEKNEWGYGQAPAGIMFITKEAFNQVSDDLRKVLSVDIRNRFAHEIAHQWWGTVVKMPSEEEQWITEAFAEYCAGLYILDFKGPGEFSKMTAGWFSNGAGASPKASIPTANRLASENQRSEAFKFRTWLVYDKGAALLHALRGELGDQAFFTFLKSAQASFRWKFAGTAQLAGLLQFLTKKDHGPFFDRYFWGTEMPALKE